MAIMDDILQEQVDLLRRGGYDDDPYHVLLEAIGSGEVDEMDVAWWLWEHQGWDEFSTALHRLVFDAFGEIAKHEASRGIEKK